MEEEKVLARVDAVSWPRAGVGVEEHAFAPSNQQSRFPQEGGRWGMSEVSESCQPPGIK